MTAAGHQCQFGVDRAKPTRIWSDILSLRAFGFEGWPIFDEEGWYIGPLPKSCGHDHKERTIGKTPDGQAFNISPSAAYPPKMCEFLAWHFFKAWEEFIIATCGRGVSSVKSRDIDPEQSSSSLKEVVPESKEVCDERYELGDIAIDDIRFGQDLVSQEEVDRATEEANRCRQGPYRWARGRQGPPGTG